jgi:hypothetical protein
MSNPGIDIQHPKLRGEWAELRFMARAAEHGLRVSKPFGDCARYDVTVEHHGKFLRVQVKSTQCEKKGYRSYVCDLRRRGTAPYSPESIDFFAVYVIPSDVWYIFPAAVAIGSQARLTLSPALSSSKHSPYKEAWHLLCGTPAPLQPQPTPAEPTPAHVQETAAPLPRHPDATLHPSHPMADAEARMLALRDRLQNHPFFGRRR